MSWHSLLLVLYLLINAELTRANSCLRTTNTDEDDEDYSDPLPSGSQAIVTSYQFQCCGNVTQWQAHVDPVDSAHRSGYYTIHFQVWRPSPTVVSDGCYSLVGEDRYENIQLTDEESHLVSRRVEPQNTISVQPGDVVGYFNPNNRDGRREGVQLDEHSDQESVWYRQGGSSELASSGEACPGADRTLWSFTNEGPVISVEIDSYSCTQSIFPSSTFTSTPAQASSTAILGFVVTLPVVFVLLVLMLAVVAILVLLLLKRRKKAIKIAQNDASKTTDFTITSNDSYAATVTVGANPAYVSATRDIPVEINESYVTTVSVSANPDYYGYQGAEQLYETIPKMDGEGNSTHRPNQEDDIYVEIEENGGTTSTNGCYITIVPADAYISTAEDIPMETYATTANSATSQDIPVEKNATTPVRVGLNPTYASVESVGANPAHADNPVETNDTTIPADTDPDYALITQDPVPASGSITPDFPVEAHDTIVPLSASASNPTNAPATQDILVETCMISCKTSLQGSNDTA